MCLLFRQRRIFARAEVPRLGPALADRPRQRCRAASDLRRRLRMYQRRRRRPGALATRRQTLPVLRFQRMIGKLQVPIVSAGGAALVAIDDLQIPMQTALIGTSSATPSAALRLHVRQSTDRAVPAASLPPSVLSENGYTLPMAILVSGSPHRVRNIFPSLGWARHYVITPCPFEVDKPI